MGTHVLIAGASMAGLRVAESLRGAGFKGDITLCGDEPHMPYNRPPLSKEVLLGDASATELQTSLGFRLRPALGDVRWMLGRGVASADLDSSTVTLADRTQLHYDALVVATGLRPRRLPFNGGESQRFVLRSIEDALALRAAMQPGKRLVVVGAGFIGCEVAASARKRGLDVTVVEPIVLPMLRAIGTTLATAMQELHETEGVVFRLGTGVRQLVLAQDQSTLQGVMLEDGSVIDADLLVEAVGSLCNVEWLEGNGLDLSNGVLCDAGLRVQGRHNVFAAGDVARFPNAFIDGQARRVEHWCVPGQTAKTAAESILHLFGMGRAAAPQNALPSFWSDQHGVRIQSFGMPALGERTEVLEGQLDVASMKSSGAALGYFCGERLIGAICVGLPPNRLAHYREKVTHAGTPAAVAA